MYKLYFVMNTMKAGEETMQSVSPRAIVPNEKALSIEVATKEYKKALKMDMAVAKCFTGARFVLEISFVETETLDWEDIGDAMEEGYKTIISRRIN